MLTDASRLRDFPALTNQTYLNTAAESVPPLCTGSAIEAYWQDKLRGMQGRDGHFAQVEACREISARMLGLLPSEVSFCSCTSEIEFMYLSGPDLSASQLLMSSSNGRQRYSQTRRSDPSVLMPPRRPKPT